LGENGSHSEMRISGCDMEPHGRLDFGGSRHLI
jgi:hypothetical protein